MGHKVNTHLVAILNMGCELWEVLLVLNKAYCDQCNRMPVFTTECVANSTWSIDLDRKLLQVPHQNLGDFLSPGECYFVEDNTHSLHTVKKE